MVDAACTAAVLCPGLAGGSEEARLGWGTSTERGLVSPWPGKPSEKQAGLEARGRNSIPVQSPAPEGWEVGSSGRDSSSSAFICSGAAEPTEVLIYLFCFIYVFAYLF